MWQSSLVYSMVEKSMYIFNQMFSFLWKMGGKCRISLKVEAGVLSEVWVAACRVLEAGSPEERDALG